MIKNIYYKFRTKIITSILQKALDKAVMRPRKIAMILSLAESNNLICKICGKPVMDVRQASCDHIIPKSKGGARWNVKNFQLAHKKCNFIKGNRIGER